MFSKIGKLYTGKIKRSVLYSFALRLIALLNKAVAGNEEIAPFITVVQQVISNMEKVFMKNSKHPLTAVINDKHSERLSLLMVLKRQISATQKMKRNPSLVETGNRLYQEMKDSGWWSYQNFSYSDADKVIRTVIDKFSGEPYAQWLVTIKAETSIADLQASQEEFEALVALRAEQSDNELTPEEKHVHTDLVEAVLDLLVLVNFGARHNEAVFGQVAYDVSKMIRDTNALTKARETRSQDNSSEVQLPTIVTQPVSDEMGTDSVSPEETESHSPPTIETDEEQTSEISSPD